MTDAIAQIFAMIFIGTILLCLIWTILEYIFNTGSMEYRRKENNKLFENMERLEELERLNKKSK
jgi:hypothetical protein